MSFESLEEIEDELDALQKKYLEEDDDHKLRDIERRFDQLLEAATVIDGRLRIAAGVSITNWVRE